MEEKIVPALAVERKFGAFALEGEAVFSALAARCLRLIDSKARCLLPSEEKLLDSRLRSPLGVRPCHCEEK